MLTLNKYEESSLIEDVSKQAIPSGIQSIELPPYKDVRIQLFFFNFKIQCFYFLFINIKSSFINLAKVILRAIYKR